MRVRCYSDIGPLKCGNLDAKLWRQTKGAAASVAGLVPGAARPRVRERGVASPERGPSLCSRVLAVLSAAVSVSALLLTSLRRRSHGSRSNVTIPPFRSPLYRTPALRISVALHRVGFAVSLGSRTGVPMASQHQTLFFQPASSSLLHADAVGSVGPNPPPHRARREASEAHRCLSNPRLPFECLPPARSRQAS